MDWIALHNSKHWKDFLASREIADRVTALETALMAGTETDAHTLGKLRGQLAVYRGLPKLVEALAKSQNDKAEALEAETPNATAPEGLSLWHRMRRFQLH